MTLRRMLKKLRLKQGDILLVRRTDRCYKQAEDIMRAGRIAKINLDIPIIFVDHKNDIMKLTEEQWQTLRQQSQSR